jgi:hypothetical protein
MIFHYKSNSNRLYYTPVYPIVTIGVFYARLVIPLAPERQLAACQVHDPGVGNHHEAHLVVLESLPTPAVER